MRTLIFFILAVCVAAAPLEAREIVSFGPQETYMLGSIPYTVLGQYRAHFNAFKGRIILDEKSAKVQSVYLEIKANSIASNCPWCDKMARSRRLLNTMRYPRIIFKSQAITRVGDVYQVQGILEMHGIKRTMSFPFEAMDITGPTGRRWIDLRGRWSINRKAFNIWWSRLLDRGGVVVGDYFTVSWAIRIPVVERH